MTNNIRITTDGLLAGERFLRERCDEFQDGTRLGFHSNFVKLLISEILCASGLGLEMPLDSQPQHRGQDGEASPSKL